MYHTITANLNNKVTRIKACHVKYELQNYPLCLVYLIEKEALTFCVNTVARQSTRFYKPCVLCHQFLTVQVNKILTLVS